MIRSAKKNLIVLGTLIIIVCIWELTGIERQINMFELICTWIVMIIITYTMMNVLHNNNVKFLKGTIRNMESELENAKHHIKCLEQELNEKEEKSATKSSKIIEYEDFVPPELWTNNKV